VAVSVTHSPRGPVPRQGTSRHHRGLDAGHRAALTGDGVEQLDLAATGHVPDEHEQRAVLVGVEELQLRVVSLREDARRATFAVRTDRLRDELTSWAPGIGHEIRDHRLLFAARGRAKQADVGGTDPGIRHQRMVLILLTVDHDAELGTAGAVAHQQEPLVTRQVEHREQIALRERLHQALCGIEEHSAGEIAGGGRCEADDEPVTGSGPGPQRRVPFAVARDTSRIGPVCTDHPDLAPHAAVGRHRTRKPCAVR
jgi:hypothetical protein